MAQMACYTARKTVRFLVKQWYSKSWWLRNEPQVIGNGLKCIAWSFIVIAWPRIFGRLINQQNCLKSNWTVKRIFVELFRPANHNCKPLKGTVSACQANETSPDKMYTPYGEDVHQITFAKNFKHSFLSRVDMDRKLKPTTTTWIEIGTFQPEHGLKLDFLYFSLHYPINSYRWLLPMYLTALSTAGSPQIHKPTDWLLHFLG